MGNAFESIATGDLNALRDALADDPAVAGTRNADGASLLAFAAYNGNTEAVALVRAALPSIDPYEAIIIGDRTAVDAALASGWDGNGLSPDGFTPLALAAFFRHKEIFDLLLPLTRDIDQRATNSQQVSALHAAAANAGPGPVELLLRRGANPNLPQQQGFRALHTAGMKGDAKLAGLLLLFGADPTLRDDDGKTAADRAREKGHDWLAERLEVQR